jgi:hypothetical protein
VITSFAEICFSRMIVDLPAADFAPSSRISMIASIFDIVL